MASALNGYHAAHLPEGPARAVVWKVVAEHLASWVAPDAHVLEIGAGYCEWINNVTASRRVAIGIWPEIAPLASNILEHFEPAVASSVVEDINRLLKPGGRLIVVQPNFRYAAKYYFDDYTHRAVFTDVSLPNLLRAHGFRVDRVEPRFLPYSMRGSKLPIRAWTVRAYLRSPIKPMAGQMLVVASKA